MLRLEYKYCLFVKHIRRLVQHNARCVCGVLPKVIGIWASKLTIQPGCSSSNQ